MKSLPIESLNRIADNWFEAMSAVAWQSAVVVLAAMLLCQLLRRRPPAVRSWIWRIVASKLLLMPFYSWTFELPRPEPTAVMPVGALPPVQNSSDSQVDIRQPPVLASPTDMSAVPTVTRESLSWPAGLMIVWAAVVLAQVGRVLLQWRSLTALLQSQVANREGLVELVEELSKRSGLQRPPAVLTVEAEVSPLVCHPTRPMLVLPQGLTEEIGLDRLRQIVLHELAHIRRQDLWWCWLPLIAKTVYWFNPLVHWATYQANLERELACDAAAIKAAETTAADYAQTLVSAASRSAPLPALQAAVNQLVGSEPIS